MIWNHVSDLGKSNAPQGRIRKAMWPHLHFVWVQTIVSRYIYIYQLTLKVPNKNCSRQHFNFLLLSFEENKA